ncbi:succinate dehydrogenase, cytochrome b556 subunit [Abyssibius alkaniclasticus]|uniref:succinate dehydrogenase, cytochrome b556 subunit n=1 Tax=Abyssibius alkaniclasticus TaxID=2881234 RepID=UPI0023637D48|nr:succinate dehydrogenase, cytochrome b556 subunit [Abyssibius alkaniclasticus]UPH71621.1 succinate dehydrogenase, cytochrome b556 subunit [Abyssibius alkaniclasticus]
MADVNRGDRPLSPHLSVYRFQFTMLTSILHRITGMGLAVAAALVVWWFLALAIGEDYFELANAILTSTLGYIILIIALWGLSYHLCNGIRHLMWDIGKGFSLGAAYASAIAVFVGATVLTVLVIILAQGV